jgi:hypothetical protein
MRGAVVAALLLSIPAVVLGGCGSGSSGKKLSDRELARLVLQSADLHGFDRFSFGPEVTSELSPVLGRDPVKFGRQSGWTARYRRVGRGGRGPLTVTSSVEVFGSAGGAAKYLHAVAENQKQTNAAGGLKELDPSGMGDEAIGATTAMPPPGSVRSVLVTWREGRFVSSLAAIGFAQRMPVSDVVALAHEQEDRLARAR